MLRGSLFCRSGWNGQNVSHNILIDFGQCNIRYNSDIDINNMKASERLLGRTSGAAGNGVGHVYLSSCITFLKSYFKPTFVSIFSECFPNIILWSLCHIFAGQNFFQNLNRLHNHCDLLHTSHPLLIVTSRPIWSKPTSTPSSCRHSMLRWHLFSKLSSKLLWLRTFQTSRLSCMQLSQSYPGASVTYRLMCALWKTL